MEVTNRSAGATELERKSEERGWNNRVSAKKQMAVKTAICFFSLTLQFYFGSFYPLFSGRLSVPRSAAASGGCTVLLTSIGKQVAVVPVVRWRSQVYTFTPSRLLLIDISSFVGH